MQDHKKSRTKYIIENFRTVPCTKVETYNIVFPKWSDLGLLGLMFRQHIRTKEQPNGHLYNEDKFQVTLRVINGKLLINNMPDCYTWEFSKLEKASQKEPIGTHSASGLLNLAKLLNTLENENEKELLADMFTKLTADLLLVTVPCEQRKCIEVTKEAYEKGLTDCVDEWMDTDKDGYADITHLNIGDFLIVSDNGVYCIRHQEFLETHTL